MKEYIARLRGGCKLQTYLYWSLLRILMLWAFVGYLFVDSAIDEDVTVIGGLIHIAVCFLASFLWEFSQAMPSGGIFRKMPASIHTALNTGLFVSSFFGIYLNWYYSVRFFDPMISAFFAFWSVLYGYEIGYAYVKKHSFAATKAMVFFAAFGVSYIFFNVCELGEFFTDQIIGKLTGEPGNAQFWSVALGGGDSFIPAINPERIPLMSVMEDILIHTASSFAALIFINIFPYRLKGKYKYDIDYGNNKTKAADSAKS